MFVTSIRDLLPVSSVPARERAPIEEAQASDRAAATEATREDRNQISADRAPSEGPADDRRAETVSRIREQFEEIQARGYLRELRLEHEILEGGQIVVKIRDARTDKVIRELPPEEQIEFSRRLEETLGALFDEQA